MKSILVPIDFSTAAETALNYAATLAKQLNNKLILFHAYRASAPITEVPLDILDDERISLKSESEEKLKALGLKINNKGIVQYECISCEGSAVDSILKTANENQVDLIIMGTTGQTGLSDVAFGSVSLKVMEKAKCPVMAIPPGFPVGKKIKKITYATDYHQSDLAAIEKATDIARATQAQLDILHISDAFIGADEEKTLMSEFKEKVKKGTSYNNLSFRVIHGYDIEDRLIAYIEDGSTDMLLMAAHHRSFFDKLFGKSITKDITREGGVPVVAFHFNAKTAVNLY